MSPLTPSRGFSTTNVAEFRWTFGSRIALGLTLDPPLGIEDHE